MQFRRMLAMINFISLTIRCLSTPFIFYCTIFSFDNYPISGRQTRICANNLMDCIRFAKIPNDSSDPSDSTMKKTPRVRHAFHSRKSEEYTLDLDRLYPRCFFIVESLLESLGSPES